MQMKRSIGSMGLLLAGIGSIIGSGWLFGPLYASQIAGPAAIISWVLGGLLMILIALTFAELGSAFPVAGGMVQYAQFSHGPLVSFIMGWMVWISSVAVAPVETLGLLQYAGNYIPNLVTKTQNVTVLTNKGIFFGALVMMLMCILNYKGAKFFSKSNNFITTLKLIVPTLTFILLVTLSFHPHNFVASQSGGFMPTGWQGILTALPLGGVIYSFIGSNTILQLAGEVKNPQRAIPFALIGSIVFCILFYGLLQFAFIGALSPSTLAHGWQQLHYSGDSGPFAGLLIALGFTGFIVVVYCDAFISPFGTAFVYTTSTARVNYGLSKIGFFPKAFQKLSKSGVPIRALALNYVVGLFLFLPFPGWQSMVSFIISCFIISYIIGPIALVGLRRQQPDQHRPFRVPYANLMAFSAFYVCNLLIYWTGWQTVYRMMIALSIGLVFFVVHCYQQKDNLWIKQWKTSWWIIPYFGSICLASYLGTFGHGTGVLPFGWDFLVIAAISVAAFFLATRQSAVTRLVERPAV